MRVFLLKIEMFDGSELLFSVQKANTIYDDGWKFGTKLVTLRIVTTIALMRRL